MYQRKIKNYLQILQEIKKVGIIANAAPEGTGNYISRDNVKKFFLNISAKNRAKENTN